MTDKRVIQEIQRLDNKRQHTEMEHTIRLRMVVMEDLTTTPIYATVSTKRHLCKCLPMLTLSNRVGTFHFGENRVISLATYIDLKGLTEFSHKYSDCRIRVKLTTGTKQCKIVGECELDNLLNDLTFQGFSDLWREGKVVLKLITDEYDSIRSVKEEDSTILPLDQQMEQDNTDGHSQTDKNKKTKKNRRRRKRRATSTKKCVDNTALTIDIKQEDTALSVQK